MSNAEDTTAVPKTEPFEEEEFSDSEQEPDGHNHTQEVAQVQKRKGGRKPIYATSEERKQRNRQAQAAFRERRTEYIKQLETTIKHHEETLQSLQQSHRSAADECLMLRYKNSLLERILLEKGIDVQAELRVKTEGSHVLSHPAAAHTQSSAVQRAVLNRHNQTRRGMSGPATKNIRPQQNQGQPPRSHTAQHPPIQPTKSPHGQAKAGANEAKNTQRQQAPIQPRTYSQPGVTPLQRPGMSVAPAIPNAAETTAGPRQNNNHTAQPNVYPPEYQAHLEQLEQDYDAQAELAEEDTSSDSPGASGPPAPGPYGPSYGQTNLPPGPGVSMGVQGQPPMHLMPQLSQRPSAGHGPDSNLPYSGINTPFDPYDPNLDADPFGLTASMHFPTQFTYQENAARR